MEAQMTNETDIKRDICEFLDAHKDRILFTISPPRRGKYKSKFMREGWPDIYGIMANHVLSKSDDSQVPFFIEVKKPGGTLSLEQHEILNKAKELGAITCVATCVADVKRVLGL